LSHDVAGDILGHRQSADWHRLGEILHVPVGLMHCPVNYKRINKPIMLFNFTLSGEYIKKGTEGELLPWRPEDMKSSRNLINRRT